MKKMNMEKIFGGFCLSERKFVESLEKGAREFGGATKIDNEIFSNYNENPMFDIFEENDPMFTTNLVGLIVPGTIDVDSQIDNTEFGTHMRIFIHKIFNTQNQPMKGYFTSQRNRA